MLSMLGGLRGRKGLAAIWWILGILAVLAVIFVVFIVLVIGLVLLGYYGIIGKLMGSKPVDLGVKFTQANYDSAMQKLGMAKDDSAGLGPNTRVSYSGSKPVDATLTNEELSALASLNHAERYPVKDAQIKVYDDGTVEMASYVDLNGWPGIDFASPVYYKGKATVGSDEDIDLQPDSVKLGWAPVPMTDDVKREVEGELEKQLQAVPGLTIESVQFQDGKMRLIGTVPAEIKRVPAFATG